MCTSILFSSRLLRKNKNWPPFALIRPDKKWTGFPVCWQNNVRICSLVKFGTILSGSYANEVMILLDICILVMRKSHFISSYYHTYQQRFTQSMWFAVTAVRWVHKLGEGSSRHSHPLCFVYKFVRPSKAVTVTCAIRGYDFLCLQVRPVVC